MIRHIVEFKLAAADDSQRLSDVDGIREHLSTLVGVIGGLRSVTVERDLGLVAGHWDVVLISEHDDNEALEAYQTHPAHIEASAWISTVVTDRAVIDFAVAD